jgi:hypothetical protein
MEPGSAIDSFCRMELCLQITVTDGHIDNNLRRAANSRPRGGVNNDIGRLAGAQKKIQSSSPMVRIEFELHTLDAGRFARSTGCLQERLSPAVQKTQKHLVGDHDRLGAS